MEMHSGAGEAGDVDLVGWLGKATSIGFDGAVGIDSDSAGVGFVARDSGTITVSLLGCSWDVDKERRLAFELCEATIF